MRSETNTPIVERFLSADGIVSPSTLVLLAAGLPPDRPPNTRILFLTYSYADLPLPKDFEVVFDHADPQRYSEVTATVVAATQQFARPWDEIPDGWKTVGVVAFTPHVPALIDELPVIDAWGQSRHRIALCARDTYLEVVRHCKRAAEQGIGYPEWYGWLGLL